MIDVTALVARLNSDDLAAIGESVGDVVALQRALTNLSARLSLDLGELEEAQATEAGRLRTLSAEARGTGSEPELHRLLENAISRTRFNLDRIGRAGPLLGELRVGLQELHENHGLILAHTENQKINVAQAAE